MTPARPSEKACVRALVSSLFRIRPQGMAASTSRAVASRFMFNTILAKISPSRLEMARSPALANTPRLVNRRRSSLTDRCASSCARIHCAARESTDIDRDDEALNNGDIGLGNGGEITNRIREQLRNLSIEHAATTA